MNNKQLQNENEISLPCTSQEQFDASQCGPCILSDEEKIILSAMVLQKGEAEAGAIFANSPGRLRDYTILKGIMHWAGTTLPTRLRCRRSYTSTWIWARLAVGMRTNTLACSSAAIMCNIHLSNRGRRWKCR